MALSESPALVALADVPEGAGGGKAAGLRALLGAGLAVPPALVVLDPARVTVDDLAAVPALIGPGPWAVRSSAADEDGGGASFAGQFVTVLNVATVGELAAAVQACVESGMAARVSAYRGTLAGAGSAAMAVVVQRMVTPRLAGVLFTIDPVTGDRGHAVIEAVAGLGESLVSGERLASRYLVDAEGCVARAQPAPGGPHIDEALARELARHARAAAERLGRPLDLEWAVDESGAIHWLQARPITTLDDPLPGEFDYPARNDQFFTRANIGEMMPGAVTPLTMNVFGDAVDFCIRYFYRTAGALTRATRRERFVVSFGGHLFLNLNQMYLVADRVMVSSRRTFERNLLGRTLDEEPAAMTAPAVMRFLNSFRFVWYVLCSGCFRRRLERAAARFDIDLAVDDPLALYETIERRIPVVDWAYTWHLGVSTHSGVMNGVLQEMLRGGGVPDDELDGALTALLTDIDGIESAAVVAALESIAEGLRRDAAACGAFLAVGADEAGAWLAGPAGGTHGAAYRDLLARHGHRCIREAELRERDWGEDPSQLVGMLRRLAAGEVPLRERVHTSAAAALLDSHPAIEGRAFRWALGQARRGVFGREYCKSLVIRIQGRVKHAYRRLAVLLVERGVLPDADLIFFFTRAELGVVIRRGDQALVRRAVKRRRLLPEQMTAQYPDVFRGAPVPCESVSAGPAGTVYQGMPVSAGTIRGPVRVVRGTADAEALRPGEIMVASFTDIGWTPYYGVAGGLVTEVGCSLSHGAAVAREYGLPMVTAIPGIVGVLATGDLVELDGRRGTVVLVSAAVL